MSKMYWQFSSCDIHDDYILQDGNVISFAGPSSTFKPEKVINTSAQDAVLNWCAFVVTPQMALFAPSIGYFREMVSKGKSFILYVPTDKFASAEHLVSITHDVKFGCKKTSQVKIPDGPQPNDKSIKKTWYHFPGHFIHDNFLMKDGDVVYFGDSVLYDAGAETNTSPGNAQKYPKGGCVCLSGGWAGKSIGWLKANELGMKPFILCVWTYDGSCQELTSIKEEIKTGVMKPVTSANGQSGLVPPGWDLPDIDKVINMDPTKASLETKQWLAIASEYHDGTCLPGDVVTYAPHAVPPYHIKGMLVNNPAGFVLDSMGGFKWRTNLNTIHKFYPQGKKPMLWRLMEPSDTTDFMMMGHDVTKFRLPGNPIYSRELPIP